MTRLARALTIAGSDSGGGAGIQADLKTFQAFDIYGMSAITSVTAQNTQEVRSVAHPELNIIADQIDVVVSDIGVDAVKIGMLANTEIINLVASKVTEHNLEKVVLDPVMVAKSGYFLLQEGDEEQLIKKLLPLVTVVTPNIPEAEIISGIEIENLADMKEAAKKIKTLGADNVLIKGGHLPGDQIIDLLLVDNQFITYQFSKIDSKNTHGTGCTLSSAIAASLAKGYSLADAVETAREYVYKAITKAPVNVGTGHGPMYHNVQPPFTK